MGFITIVLAAGKGTRMKSEIPKVIHEANGKPMIVKILETVTKAGSQKNIAVLGHEAKTVEGVIRKYETKAIEANEATKYAKLEMALQDEQLGTAHAVNIGMTKCGDYDGDILIICGDTPTLKVDTLNDIYATHVANGNVATVVSAINPNPYGYGRIIKNPNTGNVLRIVEEKEATADEKKITEINSGIYVVGASALRAGLAQIKNNNKSGEYYLTDAIELIAGAGHKVGSYVIKDANETMGVNDKVALAEASRELRRQKNEALMLAGVTIIDPANTYIEDDVEIGADSVIYPGVTIMGNTKIGKNTILKGVTRIEDSIIGNNAVIDSAVIEQSQVDDYVTIGPFAHLRPKSHLCEKVHIGNFVETKKSTLHYGVKAGHLAYLGDADVGDNVNIGAGTITCNYDGTNKHATTIGANTFVGSDSMLVAPVNIGANVTIGAGSVITKDVPDNSLSVERNKQINISNWRKKTK